MLRAAQNDNPQIDGEVESLRPFCGAEARENPALDTLRQAVAMIENQGKIPQLSAGHESGPYTAGSDDHSVAGSDRALNLSSGTVHELWASEPADMPAATALLLSTVNSANKPFLWITSRELVREHGLPYGPGLQAAGIDPSNLLLVQCNSQKDALWALEEGLKSKALTAVVGELSAIDLTASRRLVLASREYDTRCLLLMRAEKAPSSAAYSRWQVTSGASAEALFDSRAPGNAVLNARLVKHRGGERPTLQTLEWPHAPDHLSVASPVADRPVVSITGPWRQATG